MILCGTGHRPNKLGGYGDAVYARLVALATEAINRLKPQHVISGMALGWDQALAEGAIACCVEWTAAIPFEGQENRWPDASKEKYHKLLKQASKVHVVCNGYSVQAMQDRNVWMVDNSDHVLALWDGSNGGTGNCMKYVQECGKLFTNVWNSWQKYKGL